MQIGFNLPVSGPMASAEVITNIAQLGEALGFDYLTLTDHVALPDTSTPGYPYSTNGEFYTPDPGHRVGKLQPRAVAESATMSRCPTPAFGLSRGTFRFAWRFHRNARIVPRRIEE